MDSRNLQTTKLQNTICIGGHGLEGQGGERGGSARGGSSFQMPRGGERLFTARGGKGGGLSEKCLTAVGGQIFEGFMHLFVKFSMCFKA